MVCPSDEVCIDVGVRSMGVVCTRENWCESCDGRVEVGVMVGVVRLVEEEER